MPEASAAASPAIAGLILPTLLIADDDAEVRELLATQLAAHFEIVATADGVDAAIALGAEHRPDIALVGVQMPGGGGVRMARELRVATPQTAIVALSGDESDGLVRDVIASGATSYLRRGLSRAELTLALLDAQSAGSSGHPRPTLLIADDDDDLRELLAMQLGRHFTVVATAADADEAIALGAQHRPDIATIDMQMPGGGGLSATRGLRRQSPGTAIVALSGDESDAIVREVIAGGATQYLRKGIPRADLALALRDAMRAHAHLGVG